MSHLLMAELQKAFDEFVELQENKVEVPGDGSHPLKRILNCLFQLRYDKRDLMFALEIESLTVDHWLEGKGMNPTTYLTFKKFIGDILAGKSQRSIVVSETGFVTGSYVFEQQQPKAERVWYLTSASFIVSKAAFFAEVMAKFFLSHENRTDGVIPEMIYFYPDNGVTQGAVKDLERILEFTPDYEKFVGRIIGIAVDTAKLPWFIPEARTIILEQKDQQVDGYIHIPILEEANQALVSALGPELREELALPWLQVQRKTTDNWLTYCRWESQKKIEEAREKQTTDFKVSLFNLQGTML